MNTFDEETLRNIQTEQDLEAVDEELRNTLTKDVEAQYTDASQAEVAAVVSDTDEEYYG